MFIASCPKIPPAEKRPATAETEGCRDTAVIAKDASDLTRHVATTAA